MDSKTQLEEWREVSNTNGRYEVSNFGRVRSLQRNHVRIMPMTVQPSGRNGKLTYYAVTLWVNNKAYCRKVHRLVAESFIPNPSNLPQINHKDGNKLNNLVSNLEWCTAKQNTQHSILNGLKRSHRWTYDERKEISEKVKAAWRAKHEANGVPRPTIKP